MARYSPGSSSAGDAPPAEPASGAAGPGTDVVSITITMPRPRWAGNSHLVRRRGPDGPAPAPDERGNATRRGARGHRRSWRAASPSVAGVPRRPHREAAEATGRRHLDRRDPLDDCPGRTHLQRGAERGDRVGRALGHDTDRPVVLVRDPAGQLPALRLANHEPAKPNALDDALDGRLEPDRGGLLGQRGSGSGGGRAARPREQQRVDRELRADVRLEQLGRPGEPGDEAADLIRFDRRCAQVVEEGRVTEAPLLAEPDEQQIASHVAPDLDEGGGGATAL